MNVLLINGHQPHAASPGRLNKAFAERAAAFFSIRGHPLRRSDTASGWSLEEAVGDHLWADLTVLQFPLNSMGVPWSLKRYLDEVFTAGMDGRLAEGDGRTRSDPSRQYGTGGRLQGRRYVLSVTLNAPACAFDNASQPIFRGLSLDELLAPVHVNFAFFGLSALPTFAAYDVKKSPAIEADFVRFDSHLTSILDAGS